MMTMRLGLLFLLFALIISISAQAGSSSSPDEKGIITGKLLLKEGGPMGGGAVFFYDALTGPPPFNGKVKRLPVLKVATDAEGEFRAELAPGKYYIKAIKRVFSKTKDALQNGDYVYYGMDNKGVAKEYVVKPREILDIGIVPDVVPYKKTEQIIKTALSGSITDTEGKPVEGVNIFAFPDATTRRPVFYSKNTGTDGKYLLGVPEGTYVLRARTRSKGGRPAPGEYVGMFGGKTPASAAVKDGEITKGVDITVIRIPGRGPEPSVDPRTGPK